MNRILLLVLCFCLFKISIRAQDLVINGDVYIGAADSVTFFSQNVYAGPDANIVVDGRLNMPSENIYLNQSTALSGLGQLTIVKPADYTLGASALSWVKHTMDPGNAIVDLKLLLNDSLSFQAITLDATYSTWNDNSSLIGLTAKKDIIFGNYWTSLRLNQSKLTMDSAAVFQNPSNSSYVIVGSDSALLKKNNLLPNNNFLFPIGGNGLYDYTPANLTNKGSGASNFSTSVRSYANSISDEADPNNGMDRTWNIFSNNGNAIALTLQHNISTNGSAYTNDTSAFITQYQGVNWVPYVGSRGTWQTGVGAGNTKTTITNIGPGSAIVSVSHSRNFTTTATTQFASSAFFSKSTNVLQPLPVQWLEFKAEPKSYLVSKLNWSTASELNSKHFEIFTSTDGDNWSKIGELVSAGNSNSINQYEFIHRNAKLGNNFYQIKQVDQDLTSKFSQIAVVNFVEGNADKVVVSLYPNPCSQFLTIQALSDYNYDIYNLEGKSLATGSLLSGKPHQIDVSEYAEGVYFVKLQDAITMDTQTETIILNKYK